jgi:type I restriction enzyme S subunit
VRSVSLAEVFAPVERAVPVVPTDIYPMVGVRSFGGGCFASGEISGSETRYPRLLRVAAGDFVYPKLMAWEGAFAFVPEALAKGFVSPEFCTFEVNEAQADPRYLKYLFQRPETWSEVARNSAGTTVRRRRLYPGAFLEHEIQLPTIAEQKRIAARLHDVLERVRAGTEMLRRNALLSEALPVAAAHQSGTVDSERIARGWTHTSLREVLTPAPDEVIVDPATSYPNLGILSFGRGLFEKQPIDGAETSAKKLYRVHANQFIYSRLFAFEGAYAVVDEPFDGYYVSNEFPSFDVDARGVHPRFLAAYFRSPSVWEALAIKSRGLGVRRQRVQPEAILDYEIWLPSLAEQDQIARMAELCYASDRLRSRMKTHLDALSVAALNQAFGDSR